MQEILSVGQLASVKPGNKLQVDAPLLHESLDTLGVHLLVVHVLVPCTPSGAWWRTNHEVWVEFLNKLHSELSVSSLIEIPVAAIRFQGTHVKGIQSFDTKAAARPIGIRHDGATSIDFNKGTGIRRSHNSIAVLLSITLADARGFQHIHRH